MSVPSGFRIEAVVEGLDAPTMVAFDDQGQMLIAESGYLGGGSSQQIESWQDHMQCIKEEGAEPRAPRPRRSSGVRPPTT